MKKLSTQTLALLITTILLGLATISPLSANPYGPNNSYAHDQNGYWNQQHVYHHWDHYNGHQGYWSHGNGGAVIFITI